MDEATALRFVTPLVETIARSAIKRAVEAIADRTDNPPDANQVETSFSSFVARTYTKCAHLNTLVLPRKKVELSDLYVPLTVDPTDTEGQEFIVDESIDELHKPSNRLIIVDRAGKGKSTLLQRLALLLIEQQVSIPFFIELRRLDEDHTLLDEMYRQIDPVEGEFDREFLWEVIDKGDCSFLFDGYDEVNDDIRANVTDQITDFARRVPQAPIYMTSRPEMALSSFGSFNGYSIKDLSFDEACQLCRNYDEVSGMGISADLIEELETRGHRAREFLGNPFMVSLLYQAYSFTNNIPSSRATFCEEVYTSLYKHHDLTKDAFEREKRSGLAIGKFRSVLRHLAFEMLKNGEFEARRGPLTAYLENIGDRVRGADFDADDFLDDLIVSVPLLVKEGGFYEWAHRSIQEFFVAEFVAYELDDPSEGATRLYELKSPKWLGVFEFLIDLDEAVIEDGILVDLFADIEGYYSEVRDGGCGGAPSQEWCSRRAAVSYGTRLVLVGVFEGFHELGETLEENEERFEEIIEAEGSLTLSAADISFSAEGSRVGLMQEDGRKIFLVMTQQWPAKVLSAVERGGYMRHLEPLDISELEEAEIGVGQEQDLIEVDMSEGNPLNSCDNYPLITVIWAQMSNGYVFEDGEARIISAEQCHKVRDEIVRSRETASDAELLSDL